jgi:muramoyltetrapeptide carboxypeptidase
MKRQRKMEKNKGHIWIRAGIANAPIVGGCLYSLLQLKGTVFDIDYKGKILFIETPEGQDVKKGEPLPFVDSQIIDLKNAGVFDKINGLIVGKGYGYSEQEREYFKQIIVNHTRDYDFPVLFNVNIGHADPIITLPLNVKVTLNAENNVFSIDESGVI